MNTHPNCYGSMLPDLSRLEYKKQLEAEAFSVLISSPGTGAAGHRVDFKPEAWEKCIACPDYRTCYDLSLARLIISNAVKETELANPWVGA